MTPLFEATIKVGEQHNPYTYHKITATILDTRNRDYLYSVVPRDPGTLVIRTANRARIAHLAPIEVAVPALGDIVKFFMYATVTHTPWGARRKRNPVFCPTMIHGWMDRKARENGFHADFSFENKRVTVTKANHHFTVSEVLFWGYLTVLDQDLLAEAMRQGIGRMKYLPYGLIRTVTE